MAKSNSDRQAVRDLLSAQVEAWNRCDLDEFMSGYLASDALTYISGADIIKGFDSLKKRYQKKYGTDKLSMGHLQFKNLEVAILSKEHALASGVWQLARSGKEELGGVFSLILVQTDKGWKVMHDHTSAKCAGS